MEKECCDVKYKLVLTDLNMPVMDGFEAARLILKYQAIPRPESSFVPIVAVTAYDDIDTMDQCL